MSSGLVTENENLNVRSGRSKSRPPHASIESRLLNCYYCQISLDWTTSFLSDDPIVMPGHKAVKMFRFHSGLQGFDLRTCCADYEEHFNRQIEEPGLSIRFHRREPPHYGPPPPFALLFHAPEGGRYGLQIGFCPWCGRDLNSLLATFRRKMDETAPCGRGSESALPIFSHLQSRDQRESTWACGPPIVMKNTPAANAGRVWRGSGACFSGERLEPLILRREVASGGG